MVSSSLLIWVLVVEGSLLSGALMLLGLHSIWTWLYSRWSRPIVAMARAILLDALEELVPPKYAVELLGSLPLGMQIRLFAELAAGLSGERRQRLAAIAVELDLSAPAEARCRSRRWWKRLHGARLVTLVGNGEGVIPAMFGDGHPLVRAQAAEWAADHPSPAVAAELIALLTDSSGLCRFTAQDSLLRIGEVAIDPLVERLSSLTGRHVATALPVAAALADPRFLGPALSLCRDRSPQVRSLAATVVASVGGGRAVIVLTELLSDSAPEVRAAAARSLGRLVHWPATFSLAPLLHDTNWTVRRDAALALRALDAPGILALRRTISDGDHLASDIARQALDLPDVSTSVLLGRP